MERDDEVVAKRGIYLGEEVAIGCHVKVKRLQKMGYVAVTGHMCQLFKVVSAQSDRSSTVHFLPWILISAFCLPFFILTLKMRDRRRALSWEGEREDFEM